MRYHDTGSRNVSDALGTWLRVNVAESEDLTALRMQSGFFGAPALAILTPGLERLRDSEGRVAALVGSNDGSTRSTDVAALLLSLGAPRPHCQVAVVSFANAYFHPKVFHVERSDGTAAAIVGSANLTKAGVDAKHIEAAIALDTRDGDPREVLDSVREGIERWFADEPEGLFAVTSPVDLDDLVIRRVLDVPQPPPTERIIRRGRAKSNLPVLEPLLDSSTTSTRTTTPGREGQAATRTAATGTLVLDRWSKLLSRSDAQRKSTGNQRGSITLVRPTRGSSQHYFRHELFSDADWRPAASRTNQPIERAVIRVRTRVDGSDLGEVALEVTHGLNRESEQRNYTTLLHLGPLAASFRSTDLTGRSIDITRMSDGRYTLIIS